MVPIQDVAVLLEIKSSPTEAVLAWETGATGTIVSISQESGLVFFNQHSHALTSLLFYFYPSPFSSYFQRTKGKKERELFN